jgi:hypothetical protein
MLKLTDEEVSQTLTRAVQIADSKTEMPITGKPGGYEAYVSAAEEVGIPREAMVQALRERQLLPVESLTPGDVVFARSVDNSFYAAVIEKVDSDAAIRIRFVGGGDHVVPACDIRPLAMTPGKIVLFQHEEMGEGIWYSGRVTEYHSTTRQVVVSCAGSSLSVPISRIRIRSEKVRNASVSPTVRQLLIRTIVITGSVTGGIGFLLGWLLHR